MIIWLMCRLACLDEGVEARLETGDGQRIFGALDQGAVPFRMHGLTLSVPLQAVERIRIGLPRPRELPALEKVAREWVERLASTTVEERESAHRKLEKMGWPAIPYLREAAGSSDAEVRERAATILSNFEKAGIRYETSRDSLEGAGLLLYGWVDWEHLDLKTKYGRIRIPIEDVEQIRIVRTGREPQDVDSHVIEFLDGSWVGVRFLEERLPFQTQYGRQEIPWSAVSALERTESGQVRVFAEGFSSPGTLTGAKLRVSGEIGEIEAPFFDVRWILRRSDRVNLAQSSRGGKATGGNGHYLIDGIHDKVEGSDFYGWCKVGGFMTIELPGPSRIDEIQVYLWSGDPRLYRYFVEVSSDGAEWKVVTDRRGDPGVQGRCVDRFHPVRARFVRIQGTANTANDCFHVLELEVYGHSLEK